MLRWFFGVVVVFILVLAVVAVLMGPKLKDQLAAFQPKPGGTSVRIEQADQRTLIETIKAPGLIEPHTKVDISAEVSARIESLPFKEGGQVRRGDVVVKLDDRNYRASLDAATASREGARSRLESEKANHEGLSSTLEFARRTLERQRNLLGTGDVAQSVVDDAEERVMDLQARLLSTQHSIAMLNSSLAQAEAEISRAEEAMSKTVIVSPMDGVITKLNAEVGEVVLVGTMNNPGTVIMTIADLSRMIMKAEVSESDVAQVKREQKANVFINAYGDEIFEGLVTQLALQRTNPQAAVGGTGYFETEVELMLNGRQVLSGCQANVNIETAEHTGIVVPSQAIVERLVDDLPDVLRDHPLVDRSKKVATVVYRVVNNKAVCTPVKRGSSDDTHTVVLDGLAMGEPIVVGPYKALEKLKHDELLKDEAAKPVETSGKAVAGETSTGAGGTDVKVQVTR